MFLAVKVHLTGFRLSPPFRVQRPFIPPESSGIDNRYAIHGHFFYEKAFKKKRTQRFAPFEPAAKLERIFVS